MIKNKIQWVEVLPVIAMACMLSPLVMMLIGGVRTIVLITVFGVLLTPSKMREGSFSVLVGREIKANGGMIFLLVWFYMGVIISGLRGGMGTLGEWKVHAVCIFGLIYGLYLRENQKLSRFAVYAAGVTMLFHSILSNAYVTGTGLDMREALEEMSGLLGHTDYWTQFAMITILLLGLLIDENNKIIKYVGLLGLLYMYKTILFCGFATPVALFIIGHILLGFVFLRNSKKGLGRIFLRFALASILIGGSIWAIFKIATLENDARYSSIQLRFKNMIENPAGGGYDIENSRFDLAKISWDTFKQNPFLGCGGTYLNNAGTGGHQAVVDYLAIYGLMSGGGAFICFVVLCMVNGYQRCRRERDWIAYASFASTCVFVGVGLVNPGWYGGPLMVLFLYAQPFKRSRSLTPRPFISVPRSHFETSLPAPHYPVARMLPDNRGKMS
jgi:hypothetical protein